MGPFPAPHLSIKLLSSVPTLQSLDTHLQILIEASGWAAPLAFPPVHALLSTLASLLVFSVCPLLRVCHLLHVCLLLSLDSVCLHLPLSPWQMSQPLLSIA